MADKKTAETAALEAKAAQTADADKEKAQNATEEAQGVNGDPRRKVRIKLALRKGEKGIFVSVNNYRAYVPRGEEVEVPYYVARHLEEVAEQNEAAARLIESLTETA